MPSKLMRITADVEEAAFGKVVTLLNATKGVLKLDFHLDGKPKAGGKSNGTKGGLTAKAVILAALSQGPKTRKELEALVAEAGLPVANTTVHGVLYALKTKKQVANGKVKNGQHAYQLTAAGKKSIATATAKKE